jgi:hypothetical protein
MDQAKRMRDEVRLRAIGVIPDPAQSGSDKVAARA